MFGEVSTITKLGAASTQLKCSVKLYLEGEYIPALTLAGASEDIVRNCVDGETSYESMKAYLIDELGFSIKGAHQDIVGARNWLKHWSKSSGNQEIDDSDATINLRESALTSILLAATNFLQLDPGERKEVESCIESIAPDVREYLACQDQC
mgnify:CR=1 FL=1